MTPTEVLKNRLADFGDQMEQLEEAFAAIRVVTGHDGGSLVEADGVDAQDCDEWRKLLGRIDDDLTYWSRRFRQRYGSPDMGATSLHGDGLGEVLSEPVIEDEFDSSYDQWAARDEDAQNEDSA